MTDTKLNKFDIPLYRSSNLPKMDSHITHASKKHTRKRVKSKRR